MISTDHTKKEIDHIFFKLFELDPKDEEDWNEEHLVFISVLRDATSKHGAHTIDLLCYEEIREIKSMSDKQGTNLPCYLLGDTKSIQFYLKNFQEKEIFSFDGSFDYSSIDKSDFRRFWEHSDFIVQISNG